MNDNAERVLREAVHELAGDPHRPPDFLAGVISQGRRIRRRRRVGATAAMLVAIVAIAAPYVWLRPDTEPPPTTVAAAPEESPPAEPSPATAGVASPSASPSPTVPSPIPTVRKDWQNGPLLLPGGWVALAVSPVFNAAGSWVYDRAAGRFFNLGEKYQQALPAPRGSLVAVQDSIGSTEIGLLDIVTREVRWTSAIGPILSPQWSPDGSQLLVTIIDKQTGGSRFGILDPANGSFRQFPVANRPVCGDICRFSWLPNGREVALPHADILALPKMGVEGSPVQMEIFAADDGAEPVRVVPLPKNVSGATSWSPDGRYVTVQGSDSALLVDTGTGKTVGKLPAADVNWVSDNWLLYLEHGGEQGPAAVLINLEGKELQRLELPREFVKAEIHAAPI